jgi:hypothetical protein
MANSSKQTYTQLMEWLEVRKQKTTYSTVTPSIQRFSKADTYNKVKR